MIVKTALGLLLIATLWGSAASRGELPDNSVWIDARTPGEYDQGHLQQAQLIPFDGIEAGVARLALPKDTPIYLCLANGSSPVL